MWREAEQLGFDHAWTFDHVTWGGLPDSPWFAAVPTLAAAAAVTERIGLGTFVSSPNNHHPVQFMREVLALDDISRGRFLLGIGTGGDLDSRITGEDLALRDRVARFHEFTELLDRLLRDDHVTADGRFYAARDVRTLPGPVRGGDTGNRVPLVIAANGPQVDPARGRARRRLDDLRRHRRHRRRVVGPRGRSQPAGSTPPSRPPAATPAGFGRYLNLDSAPTFSLTSAAAFEDAVGRAAALGFTDVITHWPRTTSPSAAPVRSSTRSPPTSSPACAEGVGRPSAHADSLRVCRPAAVPPSPRATPPSRPAARPAGRPTAAPRPPRSATRSRSSRPPPPAAPSRCACPRTVRSSASRARCTRVAPRPTSSRPTGRRGCGWPSATWRGRPPSTGPPRPRQRPARPPRRPASAHLA